MNSGEGPRMSRRPLLVAACAAILFASGCGTMKNLDACRHPPGSPPQAKPFGGFREDVDFLSETTKFDGWPLAILGLVDLPCSLVCDVFTLPWTIKAARVRKAWPKESPAVLPEP
jgi:uncharacterized protein YceK